MNPYYDNSDFYYSLPNLSGVEQCQGCHGFFNPIYMKYFDGVEKKCFEKEFREIGYYCTTCDHTSLSII